MTIEAGEYADIGHGTTFTWDGSGSTKEYAVLSVGGPKLSADAVEKTNSNSTGLWREFMAGLKDAGEASMEINFDPDKPITVGTEGSLVIKFPKKTGNTNGATFTCNAVCTGFEVTDPIDDRMTANVSFKLTGAPTWAAGS